MFKYGIFCALLAVTFAEPAAKPGYIASPSLAALSLHSGAYISPYSSHYSAYPYGSGYYYGSAYPYASYGYPSLYSRSLLSPYYSRSIYSSYPYLH
ncbi:hypothetical protein HHI36_020423 [Cryptolaemus montrouzieri]|uniref:Uncharacterized protein n=1 Tax=Cryptolaemus montrouzieri TaxID=559131 RepID=A0ABD2NA77_9CUCU